MKCSCGEEYERIARHWYGYPNHRLELSKRQRELCVGNLLGDGCAVDDSNHCALIVAMQNVEFIDWLDDELGWLSNGYTNNMENGGLVRLRTMSHPGLNDLRGWYQNEEKKVFPKGLELTPLIFEMWYVGDGTREERDSTRQPRLHISCAQEKSVVESIFDTIPFDLNYNRNPNRRGCSYVFSVGSSKDLWSWMSHESVGYERKFPDK